MRNPHTTALVRRAATRAAALLLAAALVAGCASSALRTPVPETLVEQATVVGMTEIRFWGDVKPPNLDALIRRQIAQARKGRPQLFRKGARPVINFLAISGGGSDGAFGAGLLVGWSAAGTRPVFDIVTGVSTGALSAPFAFLGRKYDPVLKEIYTRYATRDLLRKRAVRGLLGGPALASSEPLERLIAQYVDRAFLAEIAAAHNQGRRLLIGTTNLDAQRPVIWDMGKIAASGHPDSLALFRQILLASASIPGVFPPAFIAVNADGKSFQEMHVDGGTTQQVFLMPSQIMVRSASAKAGFRPRRRVLYVIRNGRIGPEEKPVRASTLSIASRSISTLIKYQGIGDIRRLYNFTRRNGIQFRLAAIPDDFKDTSDEPFDTVYMGKLYDLAFRQASQGYKWQRVPPGSVRPAGRR